MLSIANKASEKLLSSNALLWGMIDVIALLSHTRTVMVIYEWSVTSIVRSDALMAVLCRVPQEKNVWLHHPPIVSTGTMCKSAYSLYLEDSLFSNLYFLEMDRLRDAQSYSCTRQQQHARWNLVAGTTCRAMGPVDWCYGKRAILFPVMGTQYTRTLIKAIYLDEEE